MCDHCHPNCFSKLVTDHAENEAERLVPDLFIF